MNLAFSTDWVGTQNKIKSTYQYYEFWLSYG